jgi:hypothetical protein
MKNTAIAPQNLPEKLVWYYIINIYVIYLLGGHYIFAPLLASFLAFCVVKKWWNQTLMTPIKEKIIISPLVWLWIIAMLIMEVALIIGHLNWELSLVQVFKSTLFWYRHWALFALFPLSGYLNIRPQIIYRAVCIFCLQGLILVLLCYIAYILNIPRFDYVSPLKAFGGDELYYRTNFLFPEPHYNEGFRLTLFAPWSPALGLVADVYFFLAYRETDRKWRWLGMVGAIAMVIGSVSRLAILCIPLVLCLLWLSISFVRIEVQLGASLMSFLLGIWSSALINWIKTIQQKFDQFRPGSSNIRAAIRQMTLNRWWTEAPVWGHGIVLSKGPASIGHMPLGTHHAWYGVLYLHGLVGFFAFAIPLFITLVNLVSQVRTVLMAKVGLSIILVLMIFSFGDNIENLAYLYWPGLLILGITFKENTNQLVLNKKLLTM